MPGNVIPEPQGCHRQVSVLPPRNTEYPAAVRIVDLHPRNRSRSRRQPADGRNQPDSEPSADEFKKDTGLIPFTNNGKLDPSRGEKPFDERPLPKPRPGGEKRLPSELGHTNPRPPGKPMPNGDTQQHRLIQQNLTLNPLPWQRLRGNAQIDIPGPQLLSHHRGRRLHQPHVHQRMIGDERPEWLDERDQRLSSQRDRATRKPDGVHELLPGIVEFGQHTVDSAQKSRPEPVEPDPAPAPVEQRHPKVALQPGQGPTERRLGDS